MSTVEGASELQEYQVRCMDIWSGNRSIENHISTPGLDIYVFSQPYQGEKSGGDVHYLTLCAGGDTTRLILADVSGHGTAVAEVSQGLRDLMRRFMNSKSQTRFVRALNREFANLTQAGRFATAIAATYANHGDTIKICNAGHPRPLHMSSATGSWRLLDGDIQQPRGLFNLPLGIDETTSYLQSHLRLSDGDVVILYTDAITEAPGRDGKLLGEEGLLKLVSGIEMNDVQAAGRSILNRLREVSPNATLNDDLTLMVIRYARDKRRTPGIMERINSYSKALGLKKI